MWTLAFFYDFTISLLAAFYYKENQVAQLWLMTTRLSSQIPLLKVPNNLFFLFMVIISGLYGNSVRKYNRSVLFVNKSETHFRGTCKNEYLLKKNRFEGFSSEAFPKKSFLWIEILNPSEENCFDYLPSKILLNLSFQIFFIKCYDLRPCLIHSVRGKYY